jgi:hypothetical protein
MTDEWKCLGCKCTFDGGCEYELETARALKNRGRLVIPPRYLPAPVSFTMSPEERSRRQRENRRKRIEALGGTVRARK